MINGNSDDRMLLDGGDSGKPTDLGAESSRWPAPCALNNPTNASNTYAAAASPYRSHSSCIPLDRSRAIDENSSRGSASVAADKRIVKRTSLSDTLTCVTAG